MCDSTGKISFQWRGIVLINIVNKICDIFKISAKYTAKITYA